MFKALFTAGVSRTLGAGVMAGAALALAAPPSTAADEVLPPPYEVTGANGVGLAVVWDEAAVRKVLPHGIEPVKGMTGGINIYSVEHGYGIGPYSAAYFYVDIEGFDSPQGIKGRWMLAGVYGPDANTAAALKTYIGLPVRTGTSRIEPTGNGERAVGSVNGHDFIAADFKPVPGSCQQAAILLNYVSLGPQGEQPVVTRLPFVGESCKADSASAKITAPSGDPFAAFTIAKVVGAGEFKHASFAFSAPQPAAK
jgi:hypothetical protein